jgi:hypothetical protein
MRKTNYAVTLSGEERARLRTLIGGGVAPARTLAHARILLKADRGEGGPAWADAATIDWRFATADARIMLRRLSPAAHA